MSAKNISPEERAKIRAYRETRARLIYAGISLAIQNGDEESAVNYLIGVLMAHDDSKIEAEARGRKKAAQIASNWLKNWNDTQEDGDGRLLYEVVAQEILGKEEKDG